MRRSFLALLRKEAVQVSAFAVPILLLFGLSSFEPVLRPTDGFAWSGLVAMIVPWGIGFLQSWREGRGEMWSYAIHRPASGAAIMGAKLVAGVGLLVLVMLLPWSLRAWWASLPGYSAAPFDRSFVLAGIGDFCATLTFYAAGLHAGSRPRRALTWPIGIGVAILGALVVIAQDSFAVAVTISLALTVVLAAGAWANYMSGDDFEAQPQWGRAANVVSGLVGVAVGVAMAWGIGGAATGRTGPQVPSFDGSVLPRDEWPDIVASGARASVRGEITAGPVLVASDAQPGRRGSYRDAGRWVQRLFPGDEAPVWYYDGRRGLIAIYDPQSRRQVASLGPDGFSAGATRPARRFEGELVSVTRSRPHGSLMLTTRAVYLIDSVQAPRLVFAAPEGEAIVEGKAGAMFGGQMPRRGQRWSWFSVVTTTARTVVIGEDGTVELSVAHPGGTNRSVRVRRYANLPGSPTMVWYSPHYAVLGDTANEVFVFQAGTAAPIAEQRFARMGSQYDGGTSGNIRLAGMVPLVPVALLSAIGREMSAEDRASLPWTIGLTALAALLLAHFTFRLSRQYEFSRGWTIAWIGLTLMFGPVTSVVMWLMLEWPGKEPCAGCGEPRVVSAERCEHCGSPPAAPEVDGTEVFAPVAAAVT